jgi:squalene-hopene/tetraprenyl-beta-curcumene cyclase
MPHRFASTDVSRRFESSSRFPLDSVESISAAPRAAGNIAALDVAIAATRNWLVDQQHADGFWCGELEGDSILESEYILLLAWLGRANGEAAQRAANYLVETQRADGGWAMFPGGPLEISGSVKAYFSLKLTGHDLDAEYMSRARRAILAHGGADRVNSFTRFYLALLGQIPYSLCPAVPPEMVLLPQWLPINIYRISAWSRTIFVPLSIVWAHQPVRQIAAECGIDELFVRQPKHWPLLSSPAARETRSAAIWQRAFRALDSALKFAELWRIRPFRRGALQFAQRWMLDRFVDSDGLGAIFPPIIWSAIALRCLGYADDSPELQACLEELEKLAIDEAGSRRLQPCLSPVWDTAITLRALAAANVKPDHASARRGIEWLLSKEIRTRGDWAETVDAEPGGWFFEHRNAFYPDIDDTAMAILAIADQLEIEERDGSLASTLRTSASNSRTLADLSLRALAAVQRAVTWLLAMQNRDGGWGAFDRDNDAEFLCHVPFADHNAMIDPSTPDLTARVLEAFGRLGYRTTHPAVAGGIAYLRRTQEHDGAWSGRWGVNYIYGTWQVLLGLAAVGVPPEDPMIRRAAAWLERHQQPSGAWGESAATYEHPELRGEGPPTASQTAWAILGLVSTGARHSDSVKRGIDWLLAQQLADGTWQEDEFTGTGFPRVFYLKYHYYRVYFPLLALCSTQGAMR